MEKRKNKVRILIAMKIVVDSNIIFSASLSKNSKFREILSNKNFDFYSPQSLYDEIIKHLDKIRRYSKDTQLEVNNFILKTLQTINFVHLELVPEIIFDKDSLWYCNEGGVGL